MKTTIRTDSKHQDFISLVEELDSTLAIIDGDDHDFYDQYNKLDDIKHAVIVYVNEEAVACGAIKAFDKNRMEVKRMYTKPEMRGQGLAKEVLKHLEEWTKELGYIACVLETGKRQADAVGLYKSRGYTSIPNYGQYKDVENSVCFEKIV